MTGDTALYELTAIEDYLSELKAKVQANLDSLPKNNETKTIALRAYLRGNLDSFEQIQTYCSTWTDWSENVGV